MTISKINFLSSLVFGSMALTLLTGCGGGGGGSQSNSTQGFPSGIYIAMSDEKNVRSYTDLNGAGAKRFTLPGVNSANRISFDSQGRMYVGSYGKVFRFWSPDDVLPASYGSVGPGVGEFGNITAIAFDSLDQIYIMDAFNKRIVRMDDISGKGWTTLDLTPHIPNGSSPMSLCFDSADRIYVTIVTQSRVLRFDDMADTTPQIFGSPGAGVNQLNQPTDIFVDNGGKIFITDALNHRIVRIDDMSGTNWKTFGVSGTGVGQFMFPFAITTDAQGRIYVTDGNNPRVVRINDMNGTGWVSFGEANGPEQFIDSPVDVLVR